MTTLTFDTLAYSKKLREAGFTEQQAEAQADALSGALKASASDLAAGRDIEAFAEKFIEAACLERAA